MLLTALSFLPPTDPSDNCDPVSDKFSDPSDDSVSVSDCDGACDPDRGEAGFKVLKFASVNGETLPVFSSLSPALFASAGASFA